MHGAALELDSTGELYVLHVLVAVARALQCTTSSRNWSNNVSIICKVK